MADMLIEAGLGVIFMVGGGALFLHWLGWLPKKQTITLPAYWPTDLYWIVEEHYRNSPFNLDFMANTLHRRTDPVEDVLNDRVSTWDELKRYRRAKTEIGAAFEDRRVPAPWAVATIRAYREAFATAAECEAAQLREETARLRQEAGQRQWPRHVDAEVVRPKPRHQLSN
jgi:hypothetical protein